MGRCKGEGEKSNLPFCQLGSPKPLLLADPPFVVLQSNLPFCQLGSLRMVGSEGCLRAPSPASDLSGDLDVV